MDSRNKERKKMNILFIVSILPPYPGGAAVDYRSFLQGLSKRDDLCKVSVLTEKGCSKGIDKVVFMDTLFNYDSAGAGAKSRIRQAANYLLILWRIISAKEDIIHIHARYVYSKYAGRVIWLALLLSRAKAVVDIRDRFYDNFGFGHHFIVCSEELLRYYSWVRNATCLPVPVDVKASARKAPGRHIAYFGSVARNKGILELVDGFKEYIKASKDPLELHIYGQDMIGEQFIKSMEGVDRIRFFGPIPAEEVPERISECRGVVLPSESEGMPRVCLETMMLGRVLACHRNVGAIFPCIPEEFVLEDLTPSEFKRVLTNMEVSGGHATYDYDFSAHAPENVSERLLELYTKVLGYTYKREGACSSQ